MKPLVFDCATIFKYNRNVVMSPRIQPQFTNIIAKSRTRIKLLQPVIELILKNPGWGGVENLAS